MIHRWDIDGHILFTYIAIALVWPDESYLLFYASTTYYIIIISSGTTMDHEMPTPYAWAPTRDGTKLPYGLGQEPRMVLLETVDGISLTSSSSAYSTPTRPRPGRPRLICPNIKWCISIDLQYYLSLWVYLYTTSIMFMLFECFSLCSSKAASHVLRWKWW